MKGITDRAGEVLKRVLEENSAKEGQCVRLRISSGAGKLKIDDPQPDDEVFTFEERKVLTVDPITAETYAGKMLDCDGSHFFFVGT